MYVEVQRAGLSVPWSSRALETQCKESAQNRWLGRTLSPTSYQDRVRCYGIGAKTDKQTLKQSGQSNKGHTQPQLDMG